MDIILAAQIGFSLLLGMPAIYVVLSKRYQAMEKHWAFTTLGIMPGTFG